MSKKDNSVKVRVCILNKQYSSINFSIRLKDGFGVEEAVKQINQFLKSKL